jgi:TrmH family RNA methyltransferase
MPSAIADTVITSPDNPLIRLARSLKDGHGRRRHGAFLVEGVRLVEEAAEAVTPQYVLHVPDFGTAAGRERALLDRLRTRGVDVRTAAPWVLAHATDTVTPQGVIAVVPQPKAEDALAAAGNELVVVLDAVGDPGNAGTLLRSAVGAGVRRIWAAKGTVDVFSPKVVRAGAGAHFRCAIAADLEWGTIRAHLPAGAQVLVADAGARRRYWEVDWTRPSVLVLSSEAHGASPEARELAIGTVGIPIAHVESLNVGVAGSVILFEALRQRTLKEGNS